MEGMLGASCTHCLCDRVFAASSDRLSPLACRQAINVF